jgi:hypothetical protein
VKRKSAAIAEELLRTLTKFTAREFSALFAELGHPVISNIEITDLRRKLKTLIKKEEAAQSGSLIHESSSMQMKTKLALADQKLRDIDELLADVKKLQSEVREKQPSREYSQWLKIIGRTESTPAKEAELVPLLKPAVAKKKYPSRKKT